MGYVSRRRALAGAATAGSLPVLAACGLDADDSSSGQISWTQGTRPPDEVAPPVSTEASQLTVPATMIGVPTQDPAQVTQPAATNAPTLAATTAPAVRCAPSGISVSHRTAASSRAKTSSATGPPASTPGCRAVTATAP